VYHSAFHLTKYLPHKIKTSKSHRTTLFNYISSAEE